VISVGVGTGGIVSEGSGAGGTALEGGDDAVDGATTGALDGGGDPEGDAATDVDGAAVSPTVATGFEAVGRAGATPIAPAPPPAVTGAGGFAGEASDQPVTTASGRPKATIPKKTDLGDNRTWRQPVGSRERLRPPDDRLDQYR
jgi:hypothetical protein